MTVRDLIKRLQNFAPDDVVTVDIGDEFAELKDVEASDPSGMVKIRIRDLSVGL